MIPYDLDPTLYAAEPEDAALDDGFSPRLDSHDYSRGGHADDWAATDSDFSISAERAY